tara:strand:- start:297 stop:515 length:219 start_codon:yes stop_codon:yes gene_type:complete
MIVSIKKDDDNVVDYDISKIKDDDIKKTASVVIAKVGQLEVISEALRFAIDGHRIGLEKTLSDCSEAVVADK